MGVQRRKSSCGWRAARRLLGSAEACDGGWAKAEWQQPAVLRGETPFVCGQQVPTVTIASQIRHQPHNPARWMYQLPLAAVTNRHKNSVLKQHKFIILQPCRLEVNIDLPGLRLPCLQGCVSFWRLEGRFHCLAFSSFQGPPTFLGSWPLPPSLRPAAVGWLPLTLRVSDLTLCYHLPDSFLPASSTFKDPCDWTGDPPGQSRINFPF